MAEGDREIRQRIRVENEASDELRRVSDDTQRLADETRDAGQQAGEAARGQDEFGDAAGRMGDTVSEAKDDVEGHASAMHGVSQATTEARGASEGLSTELGSQGATIGNLVKSMGVLTGGMMGTQGVLELYRQWKETLEATNRLMERNAELTRSQAQSRLDLAALAGVEDPEMVRFLDETAEFAGRDPGEVYRMRTLLQSRFPQADSQQLDQLTLEVAAAGQITEAPLTQLAQPFATLFQYTGGDARQASNILQEAIVQAGEPDPSLLGAEIAKLAGPAVEIGGMSPAEAAGFAAAGTGLGLPRESATTGLRNLILAMSAPDTPEREAIAERLGITEGMPVREGFQRLSLAYNEGDISRQELIGVAGMEAAPVVAALTNEETLADFLGKVDAVEASATRDSSIVEQKARQIFASSDIQSLNLMAKQQESAAQGVRGQDVNAARVAAAKATLDRILAEHEAAGDVDASYSEYASGNFESASRDLDMAIAAIKVNAPFLSDPGRDVRRRISDQLREELERGPQVTAGGERVPIEIPTNEYLDRIRADMRRERGEPDPTTEQEASPAQIPAQIPATPRQATPPPPTNARPLDDVRADYMQHRERVRREQAGKAEEEAAEKAREAQAEAETEAAQRLQDRLEIPDQIADLEREAEQLRGGDLTPILRKPETPDAPGRAPERAELRLQQIQQQLEALRARLEAIEAVEAEAPDPDAGAQASPTPPVSAGPDARDRDTAPPPGVAADAAPAVPMAPQPEATADAAPAAATREDPPARHGDAPPGPVAPDADATVDATPREPRRRPADQDAGEQAAPRPAAPAHEAVVMAAQQPTQQPATIVNHYNDNRTEIRIGTNYARREDPAWADVEPPLGLG